MERSGEFAPERWGLAADSAHKLTLLVEAVQASPHNLVSRRDRERLWQRHVADSLGLAGIVASGPARLLDVGSGAGFPGLVLAVVRPDLDVAVLEATGKKAAFLRRMRERLGLPSVTVLHGRAEDLVAEWGGTYEWVTARAVAPLSRLVGWTVPFLTPAGRVLAVKGDRWRDEVDAAADALARADARVVATPANRLADNASSVTHPRVVTLARRNLSTH